MAESKDNKSFFRKVVQFVSNPATDWKDLDKTNEPEAPLDFEKSELKAMIERKRRNDFVRKRELDMLRKFRREGITGGGLSELQDSSRLDDTDAKISEGPARKNSGVVAKIDQIEQAMEEGSFTPPSLTSLTGSPASPLQQPTVTSNRRASTDFFSAATVPPTQPAPLNPAVEPIASPVETFALIDVPSAASNTLQSLAFAHTNLTATRSLEPLTAENPAPSNASSLHDPVLDEAVIAFANADFDGCEQSLKLLLSPQGERCDHEPTWAVLFDFYRAISRQEPFERWAMRYCEKFQASAPQWFSLPQRMAQTQQTKNQQATGSPRPTIGWISPEHLDAEAVSKLRSQSLQMPLPWVFDWSQLTSLDVEACVLLTETLHHWMTQAIEMLWLAGDHFLDVLAEATPIGAKDVDPAYWMLRLAALRLSHRPDQFDITAIDYCITYEVSPPSFEPTACRVRFMGADKHTLPSQLSMVSEVVSSWVESRWSDDPHTPLQLSSFELSGQLVGDINSILDKITQSLGESTLIEISCEQLIRVDFLAAGDLLNWVLKRHSEQRTIIFLNAHRLVALFFGAMGIDEHAKVRYSKV